MVKHEIQLSVFYHSGEVGTAAVHYIAAPGFDIIFRHSSTMTEIAMTCDVHFNQWEEDTLDYFVNEKGFQRITIPANSWKGQTEEIINAGTPD